MNGFSTHLVFYACYFHCPQHRAQCLTLTASSSIDSLCPGLLVEEQSKPSLSPLHYSQSCALVVNELGSDQAALNFPSASG